MKSILFLIILLLSLSSCEKEEIHEIDPKLKSYFGSFNDGSWWLLEDAISSEKDSLYVSGYTEKRESSGPRSKEYFKIIEYKIHSKDKVSRAILGVENNGSTCFDYQQVNLMTSYFAGFPGVCENNKISKLDCNACGIQTIERFNLNDYSFTNVLKIWNQSDTFYYVRNIGLIKYVNMYSDYQLIEYDVNN